MESSKDREGQQTMNESTNQPVGEDYNSTQQEVANRGEDIDSQPEVKKKRRRWPLVVIPLLLLLAGGTGFFLYTFLGIGKSEAERVAEERYQTVVQISEGVNQIVAPYQNEDGMFEADEETLTAAAEEVYAYAQELEANGTISGCAYCEEGYSVSFFQEDGSTTVYLPEIRDTYSGGGETGISVIDMTTEWSERAGYRNPGETITESLSNSKLYDYGNDMTVAELKEFLGALDTNLMQAIFWHGHGDLYVDNSGETVVGFCMNEKITPETELAYAEDRPVDPPKEDADEAQQVESRPGAIATCGNETRYAVNYRFFQKYLCEVDGGLFFTGACDSAADGGVMARTFLGKGFDTYIGVTGDVSKLYSNEIMSRTAENLVNLDKGYFPDILTALGQAVESSEGSFSDSANDLLNKTDFAIEGSYDFRLREPYLSVTFSSDNASLDLEEVSVRMMRSAEDGQTETISDRLSYSDLDDGKMIIENIGFDDSYQLEVSYGTYLVKNVTLDQISERTFENNITNENVDLNLSYLDLIVEDENGNFISDASVGVSATDDSNGIIGLTQNPAITENADGESVYRIPVAHGEYQITVTSEETGTVERTVTVDEDTTVRILAGNNPAAYGDIVRQYEEQYGTLQLYNFDYGVSYTGVFLLELIDFDQDDVDELVIGYSVPHSQGIEYCALPALDVWKLENGTPVRVYEGAYVKQSDIGRHCGYIDMNGTCYLLTGWSGSDVDLDLMAMQGGEFVTGLTLQSVELMEEDSVYVYGMEYYYNGNMVDQGTFEGVYDQIYNTTVYNGSIYSDTGYTADDLASRVSATKAEIGVE